MAQIANWNVRMSDFLIDIIDRPVFYLNIETSFGTTNNSIEIERFGDVNLELVNTERVLASDLPDDIPMSKIIGNLHVSRIDGLDQYLDSYEFDCGTP